MTRAPVIAVTHGGGPMPLLGDPTHTELTNSLRTKVPKLLRIGTPEQPRAIVLVTAHWQTENVSISNGAKHDLYFDYRGFPPESYQFTYPAPGEPEVAKEVARALHDAGMTATLNPTRGWDHGVFVPMLLIDPKGTIPIVQVSILSSEDPTEHYKMGQALARLRDDNIAIVGSGSASCHNTRLMVQLMRGSDVKLSVKAWTETMNAAVEEEDAGRRGDLFKEWRKWPHSFEMQPTADHFMPLIVCAGAGGEGKANGFKDDFAGVDFWSWSWD